MRETFRSVRELDTTHFVFVFLLLSLLLILFLSIFCLLLDRAFQQASQVRASITSQECFTWQQAYFSLFESQPTAESIHLDPDKKINIYTQYKNAMFRACVLGGKEQVTVLSIGQFNSLWIRAHPFVKINKVKRVKGKCWTCAYINQIRDEKSCRATQEAAKALFIMHRNGLFMLERLAYRRRILEAVRDNPDKTASFIVDGASSAYNSLPTFSSTQTFPAEYQQHIQGVICHGYGVTLYRCQETNGKCADIPIYCLSDQIEKWKERKGHYPETIYIQVDGGPDNANETVLGWMEWLAAKRICSKAFYTR
jgi:hypothetical protein